MDKQTRGTLFERFFFKPRFANVLLFCWLWLLTGFSLGTLTLNGPVRWLVTYSRTSQWAETTENLAVKVIIITFVVVAFLLAVWTTRISLTTRFKSIRFGISLLLLFFAAASLYYWMNPQLFSNADSDRGETQGRFTFGPYPTRAVMQRLKKDNYDAIISLLHPAVVPFEPKLLGDEKKAAQTMGIRLIHLPMLPWVSDNQEALDSIAVLAKKGQGKYYVHCYLGKDRVGVVKRYIISLAQWSAVEDVRDKNAHRRLEEQEYFERGRIVQLDTQVFLTPFPTDEELFAFILAGDIKTVVCTLDSLNPEDKFWIDKEKAALSKYNISFYNLPISVQTYDPDRVLAVVRQVRQLARPMVVHGFLARGTRWESFIQGYQTNLPSLPPALFAEKIEKGEMELLAPNVAVGRPPKGSEIGGYLFKNGVRNFLYLGRGNGRQAQVDQKIARASGLNWTALNIAKEDLLQLLQSGGPYYVYGPDLAMQRNYLRRHLPGALPDSLKIRPADNPGVEFTGR